MFPTTMAPNMPTEESMLFHDVHRAHRGALLSALAQLGLQDVSQPKALIHLAEQAGGSINQRELADALHISPATMAASLKSLERNGYITKQSDQRDGRCKLLHLTQKGIDAVQRCREAFDMVDEQLYAGFTRQDVTRLDTDFERDDGFVYYDVKFINGTMEYDYTIDASTGAVLHSEMEPVFD